MDKDNRMALYLFVFGVFVLWILAHIVGFLYLLPYVLNAPEKIDTTIALSTAFGLGADGVITTFFILILKDGWQFWFRKSKAE
mgnify:CR=1 FL=1